MKPLKSLFIVVLIGFGVQLNAQKVKVKKDVIVVDKKETPLRVTANGSEFTFTDTGSGNVFITANLEKYKVDEEKSFEWLVLKSENSEHENEVDMKYVSFTLSTKKAIAEFLMKEMNFFDASGAVNTDNINTFFSEKRERASKSEFDELVTSVKENAAEYKATESLEIYVDSELKEITRKGDKIGTYRFADAGTLIIRDLDNYKIGTITQGISGEVNIASKLLTSPIVYNTKNKFSATDKYATRDFVIEAVRRMHTRGLELGHSAKETVAKVSEEAKAEAIESYKEAKANSANIYNQLGYGIDDKGERYEGKVTMLFEDIKDPTDPLANGTIVNLGGDGIGKKVNIIYLNEKDKEKTKTLSAKKNSRFCVFDENGNETCYVGVKIKSNGLLAGSGDALSIGGAGALFMKEVYKEGKGIIYQEFPSNKYYIKVDGQEKVFDFTFGSLIKEEKKIAKLKAYLNGCNYGDGTYDEASFLEIEKVKELINFYNNSCK